MKNIDRQKQLDKSKWLSSEGCNEDLSGKMVYCYKCNRRCDNGCTATQNERESQCLCAKAYNKK